MFLRMMRRLMRLVNTMRVAIMRMMKRERYEMNAPPLCKVKRNENLFLYFTIYPIPDIVTLITDFTIFFILWYLKISSFQYPFLPFLWYKSFLIFFYNFPFLDFTKFFFLLFFWKLYFQITMFFNLWCLFRFFLQFPPFSWYIVYDIL